MSEPEDFHTEDDLNGRDIVETSTLEACLFDEDPEEDQPRRRNEKDLNKNDYDHYVNRTLRAFNSNKNKRYPDEPEGGWRVIDLDTEEGRAEHAEMRERDLEDSPAPDEETLQVLETPDSPDNEEEDLQPPGGPGEPG
jgi:hypothetical protein